MSRSAAAVGGATATASASGGIPIVSIATITLIVLKLTGTIHLAWWFCIFGPFLIGLGLFFAVILVMLFFGLVGAAIYFAIGRPLWNRHERKQREKRQAVLAARRAGKSLPNQTRW